jgi:xylulokinase
MWLRDNKPEVFNKIRHILFPKDYLRFRMTGLLNTDFSDASGTLAWDFARRQWDSEILSAISVPSALFPQPQESSHSSGTLLHEAASEMGLRPGIPVAIGAGDVAAAVIGSGMTGVNTLLINAGTAAQVIVIQDTPQPYQYEQGVRYLFELGVDGKVFTMGALPSAGLSLEWWRGLAGSNLSYQDLDELASRTQSTVDSVLYIPYLQGTGTPHIVDKSLGTFVQMSASTDIRRMTRAVMEGVAFGIKQCSESLITGKQSDDLDVQITGGITKSPFMRELLTSILPGKVTFRTYSDVSTIGAAALGAVAGSVVDSANTFLSHFDFGSQEHIRQLALRPHYESLYKRFKHWAAIVAESEMVGIKDF